MSDRAKITVTGLREFQAKIREMDADLPKQIRLVLNESAELIIDYAGSHIERRSGAAAASLRPRSTQREARIALGGRRAPYAPWLDFGGQGRRKGRPPARPFYKEGRYVYRGLAVHRADITQRMSKALTDLAAAAGLEVT